MVKLLQSVAKFIKKMLPHEAYLYPIMGSIIKAIDWMFPKDNWLVVLGSNAGNSMTGSPHAIFNAMKKHDRFKPYYFLRQPTEYNHVNPFSLRGVNIFLRARFVVTSHGMADLFFYRHSSQKIHIVTWHGISMKASGLLRHNLTKYDVYTIREYNRYLDAFLTSSHYDMAILCALFNHDSRSAIIIGQPRNDALVRSQTSHKRLLTQYSPIIKFQTKAILYAPTFRETFQRRRRKQVRYFPFDDFDLEKLQSFLEDNDMVILLRSHINDTITNTQFNCDRIIRFSFDDWPDIYQILPEIDILITDYSSISYDFLLLNRPVIYIPYDVMEYRQIVGLMVDNYDYWTPGPKVESLAELLSVIKRILRGDPDPYEFKRKEICQIIHAAQGQNSTEYFINLLERINREGKSNIKHICAEIRKSSKKPQ